MSLLEIRDLTIQFGGLKAVSDVNLSLEAGQMIGLIGPPTDMPISPYDGINSLTVAFS